jgi:hypothetical protein
MTDDPQDVAEALDDDMTAGDDRMVDTDPTAYDAPDESLVVDRGGDEAEPDQVAETLAERVTREEPEVGAGGPDDLDPDGIEDPYEVGALVGDAGALDVEAELVADAVRRPRRELSAEEAAIHLTADPSDPGR